MARRVLAAAAVVVTALVERNAHEAIGNHLAVKRRREHAHGWNVNVDGIDTQTAVD